MKLDLVGESQELCYHEYKWISLLPCTCTLRLLSFSPLRNIFKKLFWNIKLKYLLPKNDTKKHLVPKLKSRKVKRVFYPVLACFCCFLTAGLATVQKSSISLGQLNPGAPAALKTKVSHTAQIPLYPCGGRNTSVTQRHLHQRKSSIRMWSNQNR